MYIDIIIHLYLIVSPDKVRDTLDSGQSRHRRRRDFLRYTLPQKLFVLGEKCENTKFCYLLNRAR